MATVSKNPLRRDASHRTGRARGTGQARKVIDEIFDGLLDDVYAKLLSQPLDEQQVHRTLDDLILALRTRRLNSDEAEWGNFIGMCRSHPLKDLLHEDPFTYRAFSKPRGYAGDAELLDLIYGQEEQWPPPEASPLGRHIFNYTTLAPAPEGVRARRGFIADLTDQLAQEIPRPHILSIAAGHLREANLSAAVKRRRIGRYVALDSDVRSLREVERSYSRFGVEAVIGSVRQLLTKRVELGHFDLVYSTGLLDYLRESTSRRLVGVMFEMLRPGGRLVVANFLPGIRDVGYMEVFMDWHLVYRTRQEMIDITMGIPQAPIRDISLFAEENQNIIFLQVTKR